MNSSLVKAEQKPFFSIFVLTYNRPQLLAETRQSLARQTFQDFEVILLDNASEPPAVWEDIGRPLRIVHAKKNVLAADLLNPMLGEVGGEWMLVLADDDILTRHCLRDVHDFVESAAGPVDYVMCGITHFNRSTNTATATEHSGCARPLAAKEIACGYCAGWGIDVNHPTAPAPAGHPSAIFVRREPVLALHAAAPYYVKPFFDLGYVHTLFQTKSAYYLDRPLVILGEGQAKEMDGLHQSNRAMLLHYTAFTPLVPLQACTFQRLAMESHFRVMKNLSLIGDDFFLRPEFFLKHLLEILADRPRTRQTRADFLEAIPLLWKSALRHRGLRRHERKLLSKVIRAIFGRAPFRRGPKQVATSPEVYRNILDYEERLAGQDFAKK